MAQENKVSLTFQNTRYTPAVGGTTSYNVDQTGTRVLDIVQDIGTVTEAINFGDFVVPGSLIKITNLDATNYVEFEAVTPVANPLIKLKAGRSTYFETGAAAIYAKANTATCKIRISGGEG